MSIQRLCQDLQKLVGKFVQVQVKSAINVVVFIENFEFLESESHIYLGEFESENYQFEIAKSKIKEITQDKNVNDVFGEFYQICVRLESGEFAQYIEVLCED